MAQILLHKQPLSEQTTDRLAREGVIAIHTKRPQDFQFLDLSVQQIQLNDMVWAVLDAVNEDAGYRAEVSRKVVRNLALLAREKRSPLTPQAEK